MTCYIAYIKIYKFNNYQQTNVKSICVLINFSFLELFSMGYFLSQRVNVETESTTKINDTYKTLHLQRQKSAKYIYTNYF